MYTLKILFGQPLRFFLTVLGVALCVTLMLFLLSVYQGVAEGSVEYVRSNDADLWVLQRHATNILRSTSMLTGTHGDMISNLTGIRAVSPILFVMVSIKMKDCAPIVYLTGYDLESRRGGPPAIAGGRGVSDDNEIVLDRSFAAKYDVSIGDDVIIKDDTLLVAGFSRGTNMFVIQYAFVALEKAQEISGFPEIVSCYQVMTDEGADSLDIADLITSNIPDVAVYDHETFLANNIQEMESGFLPLLYVVAVIGAIVLMTILSLILTINVLERRRDFAVMKALGAPNGFIPGLVIKQGLILAGTGMLLALISFFPLVRLVEKASPEVSTATSVSQIMLVTAAVGVISLASSIIPNRKLRNIYPLEVFK